ncbi:MAG: hypothetical protein IT381_32085 [Deltaproteobacteria bacterium]|nr:hypothetical protein [Deltaproteobacteria bacterium]
MDDRTIRRRFVWLALVLGVEIGALIAFLLPWAAVFFGAFMVFLFTHDAGRTLDRSPRAVHLVRARSLAKMFYVTPAFAAARALAAELEAPRHVERARADRFFAADDLDERQWLALAKAYAAIASGRDSAIVCFLLAMLGAIALPGTRAGASAIMGVGIVFIASLVAMVCGGVAMRCLRVPTRRRVIAAMVFTAVYLVLPPFHTALGVVALVRLRSVRTPRRSAASAS